MSSSFCTFLVLHDSYAILRGDDEPNNILRGNIFQIIIKQLSKLAQLHFPYEGVLFFQKCFLVSPMDCPLVGKFQ